MRMSIRILIALLIFGSASAQAAPAKLILKRHAQGALTRMSLPDGDTVLYSAAGKSRFADLNRNGRQDQQDPTLEMGAPGLWPVEHLSPIRFTVSIEAARKKAAQLRLETGFADYLARIGGQFTDLSTTRSLSEKASASLQTQIALLESCAPDAARFLQASVSQGSFVHSPGQQAHAIVHHDSTYPILLNDEWVADLENPGSWKPFPWLDSKASEHAEVRKTYFGTSQVSTQALGKPSKTWLVLLAALHEVGHVIQYSEGSFTETRDAAAYPYERIGKIRNAQAMYGSISKQVEKEYRKAELDYMRWKQDIESGATFFALDALANCPLDL